MKTHGVGKSVAGMAVVAVLGLSAQAETYYVSATNASGVVTSSISLKKLSNLATADGSEATAVPGADDTLHIGGTYNGFSPSLVVWSLPKATPSATLGKVVGCEEIDFQIGVERASATVKRSNLTVLDPNAFKGSWRGSDSQGGLIVKGDADFTPVLARVDAHNRFYVTVSNEAATAKIGLLKSNTFTESATLAGTSETGALVKEGPGGLEIENASGWQEKVYVNEGKLTLDGHAATRSKLSDVLKRAWMHLDATRTDTMEFAEIGGRTCVTNWASCNGGDAHAWFPADHKKNKDIPNEVEQVTAPFIGDMKSTTGYALMDFGGVKGERPGVPDCGVMRFTDCTQVKEMFIVRGYTTKWYGQWGPVIGHTSKYPLHGSGYTALITTTGDKGVMNGDIRINGVKGGWHSIPCDYLTPCAADLHVLSIAPTNAISLNLLGSDRFIMDRTGGVRIGEVLIFTESLTEGERQLVNEYLLRKWFAKYVPCDLGAAVLKTGTSIAVPAGRVARVHKLSVQGTTLTKTGDGTLIVDELSPADATLDVQGGAVEVNPNPAETTPASAANPWLWLDATQIPAAAIEHDDATGNDYLNEWPDANGGAVKAVLPTESASYASVRPYLLAGKTPTGKTVVNFPDKAWMWLNEGNRGNHTREAFVVMRFTAGSWKTYIGSASNNFLFEGDVASEAKFINSGYAFASTATGLWTKDGAPEDPFATRAAIPANGDFYLLSFAANELTQTDRLAIDREIIDRAGNRQIAEYIMYDRRLTDDERRNTEAYLMAKWLGKSHPSARKVTYGYAPDADRVIEADGDVSVAEIVGGSTAVVKVGAGDATVVQSLAPKTAAEPAPSFTVSEGALNVSFAYPVQPTFHFAADDAATSFDSYEENGKTFVRRWYDHNGNGVVATSDVCEEGWVMPEKDAVHAVTNPTLTTLTFNGKAKPSVCFGGRRSNGNGAPSADSTTAFMDIAPAANCNTIREAHAVFAGNGAAGWPFTAKGPYHYHRGYDGKTLFETAASANVRDGEIYVNNVQTDRLCQLTTTSPYLVSCRPLADTTVDRLSGDRIYNIGGTYISEEIVFAEALPASRSAWLREALMAKWFEDRPMPVWTNEIDRIEVAEDSSFMAVAGAPVGDELLVVGEIAGNGSVSLPGIVLETSALTVPAGGPLTVNADLTLAEGSVIDLVCGGSAAPLNLSGETVLPKTATLRLDVTAIAEPGSYRVLAADLTDGTDISGWTLNTVRTGKGRNFIWTLSATDDGIYANAQRRGFMMLVR